MGQAEGAKLVNSNVFVFLYTTLLKNLRSSSTSTCFHQDALLFKLFRFGRIFSLSVGVVGFAVEAERN